MNSTLTNGAIDPVIDPSPGYYFHLFIRRKKLDSLRQIIDLPFIPGRFANQVQITQRSNQTGHCPQTKT